MLCTRWPIDAAIDRTAAHIPLLFFFVLQVFGLSLSALRFRRPLRVHYWWRAFFPNENARYLWLRFGDGDRWRRGQRRWRLCCWRRESRRARCVREYWAEAGARAEREWRGKARLSLSISGSARSPPHIALHFPSAFCGWSPVPDWRQLVDTALQQSSASSHTSRYIHLPPVRVVPIPVFAGCAVSYTKSRVLLCCQ